jgi:hypothetical protein
MAVESSALTLCSCLRAGDGVNGNGKIRQWPGRHRCGEVVCLESGRIDFHGGRRVFLVGVQLGLSPGVYLFRIRCLCQR